MQNVNMDKDLKALELVAIGVIQLNNLGEIFRCKRKLPRIDEYKLIEPRLVTTEAHGYRIFNITLEPGNYLYFRVHRLVWMIFNESLIPEGQEINHKDGNKAKNAPDNLESLTQAENIRVRKNNKLNHLQVKQIRELQDRGVPPKIIAEMFKVSRSTISNIKMNVTWKDVK